MKDFQGKAKFCFASTFLQQRVQTGHGEGVVATGTEAVQHLKFS